jgi:formate dehydrogenase subunit delta
VSDPTALVRMVNQIAANVAHHPHDQAVALIEKHLRATWAPSMRADLVAYLDAGGVDLAPLAADAAERLRAAPSRQGSGPSTTGSGRRLRSG